MTCNQPGVKEFMVEKSGIEKPGVEAWGWKVRHGFVIFLVNQTNVCQFEYCAVVGLVFGAPWCMKSNFVRFTSFLNRAFLCTKNGWSLVGILQQSLWKFIITVIISDGLFGLTLKCLKLDWFKELQNKERSSRNSYLSPISNILWKQLFVLWNIF